MTAQVAGREGAAEPEDDGVPLSDEQLGCWLASPPDEPPPRHYLEWRFDTFDLARLCRAWQAVLAEHPACWLRVDERGNGRLGAAHRTPPEPRVLDLRDLGAREAAGAALRRRNRWIVHPPSEPDGPRAVLGVTLFPGGAASVHLSVDRLAADAWRLHDVLVAGLATGYADPAAAPDASHVGYAELARSLAAADSPDAAGTRPPPALPPRPPHIGQPSLAHRVARGVLPAAELTALRRAAAAHGVDLGAALCAGLAEVLRAHSGTEAFTVDRLTFHRDGRGTLGNFAVHEPMETDGGGATFAERCASMLVRRGAPRQPSVRVVDRIGLPCRAGFGVPAYAVSPDARAPLELCFDETPHGELTYTWQWHEPSFPPAMARDMLGAFTSTLRAVAEPAGWSRDYFEMRSPAQLARRTAANATEVAMPERLLHDGVRLGAARTPDAAAVITTRERFSYRELDRRVNQVGHALRGFGVRPNHLVAIVAEKGWEQIVATHGVLAAGAAYLPVDPTVPAERLKLLLEQGAVEVVLTSTATEDALCWPPGMRRLCVDRDFTAYPDTALEPVQRQTDLAYVIFTSGSTGTPKGVMVDHRGAMNTILDINARFGIDSRDRCIAVSGLHFDLSVYDTFGMFDAGGAVVLPDPTSGPDPVGWSELIATEGVTFWNSVPALLEMLVTYLELAGAAAKIGSLRRVILAGDWIPMTLPDRLRAQHPEVRITASGGPAESCVWSVAYPVGTIDPRWRSIPYGKPLSNQRYHVLDARDRPRPDWVPGEIHIASAVGLAHGYWRDPQRSAERFRRLPGIDTPVYASGDLGRYLPDGNIEILGRQDFQIKIQGVRVELGEIEAALTAHPSVRIAVVVAGGRNRDLPVLKAFVVSAAQPSAAPPPVADELRAHLAATLPGYMVPRNITVLDELPLTGNGKVDRLALAAGASATQPAGQQEADQRTLRMARLCAEHISTEHRGAHPVSAHTDLADLGVRPVELLRLAEQIDAEFGVRPPARALCAARTPAEIVALLATP